ncbi:MAG TPA: glucose-6-phosphate isomerase [Xanthomonadaceae bacterium]|nr:glucose-6-phosphate isomerase [Xanthomonadaceae bacterium]
MQVPPRLESLVPHAARLRDTTLVDLCASDPARASGFSLRAGPLYLNYARQRLDREALDGLHSVAARAQLPAAFRALFDGEQVNTTERRAALHTALRSGFGRGPAALDAYARARAARARAAQLRAALADSEVTDVVSVGIGGSDLGPRLVVDALREAGDGRFRVHFLANVDAHAAERTLRGLDPARTAAVLVSKSFGTEETLLNGQLLRRFIGDDRRIFAVTANDERARTFGVAPERILPMWDWVGGRYSLWSPVGFAIELALGSAGFDALLEGAAQMDAHVLEAPPQSNAALVHALLAIWNRNALGLATQAIVPYDERLRLLPGHLQQLVMESLGKRVGADGARLQYSTVPVVWGGTGTSVQHSFFQALHQGTETVPVEFIAVARPAHDHPGHHDALLAHALAQAQALAVGQAHADPHRVHPGNRPSTMIVLDALTPQSLGALIAFYEHSVYAQSVLWGIDAFDQWGVELGKRIAGTLLPAVRGEDGAQPAEDPVTRAIVAELSGLRR